MIHNDVLRRLRYALSLNDNATVAIFGLADYEMELDYLHAIMKKEGEAGFTECKDKVLSLFLDGLITQRRGKPEGKKPAALQTDKKFSNNEILRKIRIAMAYKDDDIIGLLNLADFKVSKTELSALFRSTGHRNYRECGDQLLRNLLQGMAIKYR
jgi:uncharacterized protein YehS (DUF1456 family)